MPATPLQVARARIARAARHAQATGDDSTLEDARRDYAAAVIESNIERALTATPPLTVEQRAKIATAATKLEAAS